MSSNHSVRDVERPAPESAGSIFAVVLATVAVFLLAAATRLAYLSSIPHFDELYHVLAARGLIEYGEPRILEGLYNRALEYTWIVAGVFSIFGESLEAARMTSVIFGSALVAALFAWVRHLTGWVGGSVAAAMAIFWPTGIEWSQIIRFYAPFGFLAFLGFISVYSAVFEARSIWTKVLTASFAVMFFYLALRLQVSLLIGLVGLGVWFFLLVLLPAIWVHRRRNLILISMLLLCCVTTMLIWHLGILDPLIKRFLWVPDWGLPSQYEQLFYYRLLRKEFLPLWPWIPFVTIMAIARSPKPALFCTVIFGISLALHSLAGMKAPRYIYYVMPLMFTIYGIAAAAVVPAFIELAVRASRSALQAVNVRLATTALAWVLVAVAGFFTLTFQSSGFRAALGAENNRLPWTEFTEAIFPWVEKSSVLATNRELHAIYYFGRADLIVSPSRMSEISDKSEFSTDHRTGLPVVSTPTSLAEVVACMPNGIYVRDTLSPLSLPLIEIVETLGIETTLTPIEVQANLKILEAIYWETARIDTEHCKDITDVFAEQPA